LLEEHGIGLISVCYATCADKTRNTAIIAYYTNTHLVKKHAFTPNCLPRRCPSPRKTFLQAIARARCFLKAGYKKQFRAMWMAVSTPPFI